MISEVFSTIRNVKPFFLLVTFLTVSMSVFIDGGSLLTNPLSPYTLFIPVLCMMSYTLSWVWVYFIIHIKCWLPEEDLANMAVWVACSLLAFALIITFSFFGKGDGSVSLTILREPSFPYTVTLYILALFTFELAKR